jgi:DNA-binding NarL/FixJ family response regulator
LLTGRAALAAAEGRSEQALRLAGAAAALGEATGLTLLFYVRLVVEPFLARAETALGERPAAAARAAGRCLTPEQAIAEALADVVEPLAPPVVPTPHDPDGLTGREVEVLRLLAGGQTNAEIAATLSISVHTVERHVSNLYLKLHAHNRAEATAYALRHGLA